MTFISDTKKFITEYDNVLYRKQLAWNAFCKSFPDTPRDDTTTLADRLEASTQTRDLYWLLSSTLHTSLRPEFSHSTPAKPSSKFGYNLYTRFNVWFLGATHGIELQQMRSFLEEKYGDDDLCEVCGHNDRMPHGHLSNMSITVQTLLYMIFRRIRLTAELAKKVANLERAVEIARANDKLLKRCGVGRCPINQDDDTDCACQQELSTALKNAEEGAKKLFDTLWYHSDLVMTNGTETYFLIGLGDYVIHKDTPTDREGGFAVMRTEVGEKLEFERIDELKRKEAERKREYERKVLQERIDKEQKSIEKTKKRLAEIDVTLSAKKAK